MLSYDLDVDRFGGTRGVKWALSGVRWALGDQVCEFNHEILASGVGRASWSRVTLGRYTPCDLDMEGQSGEAKWKHGSVGLSNGMVQSGDLRVRGGATWSRLLFCWRYTT